MKNSLSFFFNFLRYSFVGGILLLTMNGCTKEDLTGLGISEDEYYDILTKSTMKCTVCEDSYIDFGWGGTNHRVYKETRCWTVTISTGGSYNPKPGEYITPDIPSSSGGSSKYKVTNTGNGTWKINFPYLENVLSSKSNLDLYGKYWLDFVLEGYSSNAAGKRLLESIKAGDIKIDIIENKSLQVPAQYNAKTKQIEIRDARFVSITEISEEFAHAAQHQLFYGETMNNRYKNYEFEAKAFFDISRAVEGNILMLNLVLGQDSVFLTEYFDWMEEFERSGYFMSGDVTKFRKISKMWVPPAGSGYGTEFIENFTPQVLRKFIRK